MTLKALIFDVDGTLAETEELHRRAFNETFADFDLPWRWSPRLYGELLKVAGGKERILYYVAHYQAGRLADIAPRVAEVHAHKTRRYEELMGEEPVPLRPGVARLIAEARAAGLRLAVATTTSRANLTALLRSAFPDGDGVFDAIVAGDEVARKKPFPDVYERVLDELGLDAESCIAIEDSRNGVAAARGAGLEVVVTPGLYTAGEDFPGALSVVSELGLPARSYEHLAGAGRHDRNVTVEALERWHGAALRDEAPARADRPILLHA
jgi:HAD superfamily hydrolase (TIGR01509 family)